MELTRRQIAFLVALLYAFGGLLLLDDYSSAPKEVGAHLPLAWHVLPLSVGASFFAFLMDCSAPLDPACHVPVEAVKGAFVLSLMVCSAALMRMISGPANAAAQKTSDLTHVLENEND
jgi:hypothetical protein